MPASKYSSLATAFSRTQMNETEKLKKKLTAKKETKPTSFANGLSTGSTLLNLACSGQPSVGFLPGHYYFLVGDSASGKTFLSLTCLAEAAKNPHYKGYRFIYDNAEDGALMDIKRFFGQEVSKRMMAPAYAEKELIPTYSKTIEEFFWNIDDAIKAGPFIYILDSMDSLSTEEEGEKFEERKKAAAKGKEVAGSYGTSKAKANSAGIRRLIPKLRETGSILIVISQTRDSIGSFSFEKKTRSGGHALRFYATIEMWSSTVGKIKKTVRGQPRQLGITCQVAIKKNRLNGRERKVEIPIYHSFGIDDVGGCVDWLLEEKHWTGKEGNVDAAEFNFAGKRDKLIELIEEQGKERDLRMLVADVWNEIEEACEVKRKRRYE